MAEEIKQTMEETKEEAKIETKVEEKDNKKKEAKVVKIKKNDAKVMGWNLSISYKEGADICSMIRGRNIDTAIKMVEEVIAMKRPVMMNKREASHQHGKGIMAGGFPINACKDFLRMLKQLKANAIYNELELEKVSIFCKADKAACPYRRGGRRFKRSNVLLILQKNKNKEDKVMLNKEDRKNKLKYEQKKIGAKK